MELLSPEYFYYLLLASLAHGRPSWRSLPEKEVAMSSSDKPFTTVAFEDGTFAVVRTDPRKPRLLEVIAIFYDASRARSYAEMENASQAAVPAEAPQQRIVEPTNVIPELDRRRSV
jgi:hypothetical protein